MKCNEIEETIDSIFDGEADDLQTSGFEKHLANCSACRASFEDRQIVQSLFKNQFAILPSPAFDARMLREFAAHQSTGRQSQPKWFRTFVRFLSPSVRFAAWGGILIVGMGTAFLLGRTSVSPSTQTALSNSEIQSSEENISPKEVIKLVETEPVIITKTEYKTRYVKVPIVREKVLTKFIVQGESRTLKTGRDKTDFSQANAKIPGERKDIAEQFNLKDLQPVAGASYKIIRKGDTNE